MSDTEYKRVHPDGWAIGCVVEDLMEGRVHYSETRYEGREQAEAALADFPGSASPRILPPHVTWDNAR